MATLTITSQSSHHEHLVGLAMGNLCAGRAGALIGQEAKLVRESIDLCIDTDQPNRVLYAADGEKTGSFSVQASTFHSLIEQLQAV